MKRLVEKISKLETVKRIELAISVLLTAAVLVAAPAMAWFALNNEVEVMTKIKEPDNLDIRSGDYEPIIYFDLRDIDIKQIEAGGKNSAQYVFSVSAGEYGIDYKIQIAHTTNIPFTYRLYKATRLESPTEEQKSTAVVYYKLGNESDKSYYSKGAEVHFQKTTTNTNDDKARNGDEANLTNYGRILAEDDGAYYEYTYDELDTPEIYAIPLYHHTGRIDATKGTIDYFILELSWDTNPDQNNNLFQWNRAANNKETDIIIISASKWTT